MKRHSLPKLTISRETFLKAVFLKFYLVHSWIPWPIYLFILLLVPFYILLTLFYIKWVSEDPSAIFLATNFTRKMLQSSDSMYSSIFMLGNIWYRTFTWSRPNSQDIVNCVHNFVWVPWGVPIRHLARSLSESVHCTLCFTSQMIQT